MRKIFVLALMAAVVAALGLLPAGTGTATHPTGLVAYWPFDESGGTTAFDAAHDNDGTITGATYTGGGANAAPVPGNADALNFDSSGPDLVRVPDDPDLEPANVTVSAWVRAGGSPGSARYIVVKGAQVCSSGSYALYTGGGGARFYIRDLGGYILGPSVTAAAIWDGSWHHLAGTYDGATLRMYLDGTEVAGAVASATTIAYGLATNDDLLVGQYGGTCSLPFSGDIDEVCVWNRALAPTEIATYASGVPCVITVDIDIKPGSDPNCINPDGHGVIPVAILTTEDFDASTVDPFSVTLEGSGVRVKGKSGNAGSLEDVDGDGDLDLVVQITDDSVLTGLGTATLMGLTFDGTPIQGSDSICIVPPDS